MASFNTKVYVLTSLAYLFIALISIQKINGMKLGDQDAFSSSAVVALIKENGTSYCGGTLVHSSWVLTTVYCSTNYTEMHIVLGVKNLLEENGYPVEYFAPQRVVNHPCYDPDENALATTPLALIKLNRPSIDFSPVCFPVSIQTDWNVIRIGGTLANCSTVAFQIQGSTGRIRQFTFHKTSQRRCKAFYSFQVSDEKICSFPRPGQSLCGGDEGASLLCISQAERCYHHYIVGVTVGGTSLCLHPRSRNVYVPIFPHISWMRSVFANRSFKKPKCPARTNSHYVPRSLK